MKNVILAPSILSADFADLGGAVRKIESGGAGVVHIDVMDGHFVPEISYGQVVVRSLRPMTSLPFDVHLMIDSPERQIESFAAAGADWITFHYENTLDGAERIIRRIKGMGLKAGISIKPATPVERLQNLLNSADIILIMTVEPGYGGQKLIPECLDKVRSLVRIREERGLSYMISVDGGVNASTLAAVLDSGVDIVVSGSAFFNGSLDLERFK